MASKPGDVHVLIIRAWVEPRANCAPLRIRILDLGDARDAGGETLAVVSEPTEASRAVEGWLRQLADPRSGHQPGGLP